MRLPKPAVAAILGLSISTPLALAWAAQNGQESIVYGSNYAQDRAEIEDLMARYLYAFDWQDPEAYAATFTEDGVLEFAGGIERGREELAQVMRDMAVREKAKADASFPPRRHRVRHYVTNLVLEIDGDTARSTSYWWEFNNDARAGRPYLGTYGHYEDELKRVDGRWLFAHRKIYNEENPNLRATDQNPVYRP
jgi:ketosteroid isomerase-like protein